MKKHKVLKEALPLLIALFFVGFLLFSPFNIGINFSKTQLQQFAQNPGSLQNFTSFSVRQQLFSQKDFLPILGSSELEHLDPFHPSPFFMKYDKETTPLLVGMPGTHPITHYFYLLPIQNELKNRKVVFIISPQWFTKNGLGVANFQNFVSTNDLDYWMSHANSSDYATQQMAKRLLGFKEKNEDVALKDALTSLSKGENISKRTTLNLNIQTSMWKQQDLLFSRIYQWQQSLLATTPSSAINMEQKIIDNSLLLPPSLNFKKLDQQAYEHAKENSTSNPYRISDSAWNKLIKPVYEKSANSQKDVSYLQSPTYADFQQLLNIFAANNVDVQFIIQPVNNKWMSYTGLSMQMLQTFSQKITYQLQSQGFNNIVDFTDKYNEPFFIGDTTHLGNRGWVAVNQHIMEFLKKPSPGNIDFRINNEKFLSQEWKMKDAGF
ncbi:MAG: D-alanyl-lipoteichoic acid biosynthesis protein DltD [Streptococcaceae bacterium]|jgi:D-alanine transfer protein|nr:D-alanyl-lipoteichoic acid biosynthesis protein DltD [Streptococcaceae bacterium]